MAENKSSSSKSLLIFVIVLFALIAALCINIYIYYPALKNYPPVVQPTITPTSNIDISDWKTYRNEEYGFDIKYPSSFTTSKSKSYYGYEAGFSEVKLDTLIEFHQVVRYSGVEFEFVTSIDASENNIEELEKIYDRISSSFSYYLNSKKEISINKRKGIEYRWGMLEGGIDEITILLPYNSKTLIVRAPETSDFEDIFNQIISTFKFIK